MAHALSGRILAYLSDPFTTAKMANRQNTFQQEAKQGSHRISQGFYVIPDISTSPCWDLPICAESLLGFGESLLRFVESLLGFVCQQMSEQLVMQIVLVLRT